MGLDQESQRFLSGMDEVAKGYNPELSRLVDELRFQNLGKPIVYAATTPSMHAQQQIVESLAKLAGNPQQHIEAAPAEHGEELIGYILPVTADQNRHLVIFKDGTMFVTEPSNTNSIPRYRANFAASDEPFTFDRFSLAQIKAWLGESPNAWDNKILYRNDNPADVVQIDAAREQATQVAVDLREQRMRAKQETSRRLIDSLKGLLFPAKPPQPEQPQ